MAQSNLKEIQIKGLIPPNPAALDFESQFRSNLEAFLSQMIVFEDDYQSTVAASGTDGSTLGESISLMQGTANANFDAIKEALEAASLVNLPADKDWQSADGTSLFASSLRFESLDLRFQHLDTLISDGYTQNDESLIYLSLQDRFKKDEVRIKDSEDKILAGYQQSNESLVYTSLQDRFNQDELRIKANTDLLDAAIVDSNGSNKGSIQAWFTEIEGNVQTNTGILSDAKGVFTTLKGRLDNIDIQYDADNGGAATINDRFLSVEGRVDGIDSQYDDDKGTKPDGTPYNSIDERMIDISAATTAAQAEIDAAELRLDAFDSKYLADSGTDSLGNQRTSIDQRFTEIETGLNNSSSLFANISGDSNQSFATDSLTVGGTLTLSSTADLDVAGSKIINIATPTDPNDAVNFAHVDNIKVWLDGRIGALESGMTLPDPTGMNDKFLQVSNAGAVTWADPPDLDPNNVNTGNYEWLPQVPFQAVQFDGEVYSSRTLAPGFTYFCAGDLYVSQNDSNGNPVTLTVGSGSGAVDGMGNPIKGAVLIVQGHVIGNASGIVVDTSSPHKGRLIVENWSDSKSDYLISEITGQQKIVRTSELNLIGKHQFSSRLVMEANTKLIVDTACDLIFKESLLSPTAIIQIDNDASGNPLGTVTYFDPIKIIENAPAALDTLQEVAAILEDPNTGNVVNLFSKIESDVQAVSSDVSQVQSDLAQAQSDISQAQSDISQAQTAAAQAASDAAQAAADVSNVSIGNLVATTEASTGDLVYKFSP